MANNQHPLDNFANNQMDGAEQTIQKPINEDFITNPDAPMQEKVVRTSFAPVTTALTAPLVAGEIVVDTAEIPVRVADDAGSLLSAEGRLVANKFGAGVDRYQAGEAPKPVDGAILGTTADLFNNIGHRADQGIAAIQGNAFDNRTTSGKIGNALLTPFQLAGTAVLGAVGLATDTAGAALAIPAAVEHNLVENPIKSIANGFKDSKPVPVPAPPPIVVNDKTYPDDYKKIVGEYITTPPIPKEDQVPDGLNGSELLEKLHRAGVKSNDVNKALIEAKKMLHQKVAVDFADLDGNNKASAGDLFELRPDFAKALDAKIASKGNSK